VRHRELLVRGLEISLVGVEGRVAENRTYEAGTDRGENRRQPAADHVQMSTKQRKYWPPDRRRDAVEQEEQDADVDQHDHAW
jgi:hypothetical protein